MRGRGYGWGFGYGRGGGRGRFGWFGGGAGVEGYTYVGPCRCGWGPHAYYTDEKGRLVHASELFGGFGIKREIELLKRERDAIDARIRELERLSREKGDEA